MKKNYFVPTFVFLIVGFFASAVFADDDTLAKFEGGIGVIPVSSGVGTATTAEVVNRNIVRGVQPAGQIWVIRDLEAEVNTNGQIKVEGKGLILGGGNNAGRATGQNVFATLICEDAAPFTQHSTNLAGVTLAANGDFKINDVLTPLPPPDCASPMLLIRTAGSGNWFAAGIVDFDDD
ncbi:MAG TPA: hypothetical protein VGW77_28270 [Candidatus Binatia bacterium]|jgi:hypothetical protein|nr:hypothetical protein [Candidatus Binatia bacterium]